MPIDITLLREDRGGNPEMVRESQRRRFASVELVDEVIALDNSWRRMTGEVDNLKKQRNAVQKRVGVKKKAKEECDDLVAEVKAIGEQILRVESEQVNMKKLIDEKLGKIGNIVEETVPTGNDEDTGNRGENVIICHIPHSRHILLIIIINPHELFNFSRKNLGYSQGSCWAIEPS